MTLSRLASRLRLPLGFVVGALYIASARPSDATLAVGAGVALAGVLVRAWAAGHIMKNDKLATTGPYAHTRNPLYFGSFLIACGFAIAAHWALLIFVFVFWLLIYGPTIARERTKIMAMFPDSYPEFERQVPPFFPRFFRSHSSISAVFSTFLGLSVVTTGLGAFGTTRLFNSYFSERNKRPDPGS